MAYLKVSDFYYGSVLSKLFNSNINPALIEAGDDRQIYSFTTNNRDFVLFVKYRAENTKLQTDGYYSWSFNIKADIDAINKYIALEKDFVLALVCAKSNLAESELVLLTKSDLNKIIELEKKSISISRKSGEKKYRLAIGGGRGKAYQIKFNRWEELF